MMQIQPSDSGFFSDKGPYRPRNEDVALVKPESGIYVLADGLGGSAAGDRAARIAAELLISVLLDSGPLKELPRKLLPEGASRSVLESIMPAEDQPVDSGERIRIAYTLAHYRVLAEGRDTGQVGMATAIVSLWLAKDTTWIGHVGDCRAYALNEEELTILTKDHSLSTALAGKMVLPQSTLDSPFLRSRLTQVVGGETVPTPEIVEWQPDVGARLLLCSDGVWGSLTDEQIRQGMSDCATAEESSQLLVELALNAGSRDNATAMTVFF
jgi:protein phosphatase